MTRIHLDEESIEIGKTYILSKELFHYLVNVLRKKVHEPVTCFNGDGNNYFATIINIDKKNIEIKVNNKKINNKESNIYIHVVQALCKGEKLDFVLQKCTELGVNEFTFLNTENSDIKLKSEKLTNKYLHWQGIISHAVSQSGRSVIPKLNPVDKFDNFIKTHELAQTVMLYPKAESKMSIYLNENKNSLKKITLLIGPEGDFSLKEIDTVKTKLTLGPRILRTETAALAAVSMIQGFIGDF